MRLHIEKTEIIAYRFIHKTNKVRIWTCCCGKGIERSQYWEEEGSLVNAADDMSLSYLARHRNQTGTMCGSLLQLHEFSQNISTAAVPTEA